MYTVKGLLTDESGDLMAYKDMTFCEFYRDCEKGEGCERALTKEVSEQATKWWGAPRPPIATFEHKPNCYDGIFFYNPENK